MKPIHISAWLLALSSGILQVLIFPRPNLYFLCWVALAPLIYAVLRAREQDAVVLLEDVAPSYLAPGSLKQGFVLGYVSGVVWYLGSCYWVFHVMHLYGGLHPALAVILLVLFSLYLALYHGIFGALLAWAARKQTGFSRRALVVAPFLWVTVEFARSQISGFPWDLLGTTQVDNIPLSRIATITGVHGVSFEIALVNAAFAAVFLVPKRRRVNMFAAVLFATVALQAGQLVKPEPERADRKAILVQQNIPIHDDWTAESFERTVRELHALSIPANRNSDPGLVVWPESPAPFLLNDPNFLAGLADVARDANAYLVVGSIGIPEAGEERQIYNSAALVSPDGHLSARYDKVHLVPFGEYVPFQSVLSFAKALTREVGNFRGGADRYPLRLGNTQIGTFICYESIFPDEVRVFALRGAQVFVNISNDGWFGETGAPEQHFRMARMRAIENERWLLRGTNTGITASIDPYGRVIARIPRNRRASLEAPYALLSGTTFYTEHGDWFAILCAIISIIVLFFRVRTRAQTTLPLPV